jgi:hypothetical protein
MFRNDPIRGSLCSHASPDALGDREAVGQPGGACLSMRGTTCYGDWKGRNYAEYVVPAHAQLLVDGLRKGGAFPRIRTMGVCIADSGRYDE